MMYPFFLTDDTNRDSSNSDDESEVDQNTNKLGIFDCTIFLKYTLISYDTGVSTIYFYDLSTEYASDNKEMGKRCMVLIT